MNDHTQDQAEKQKLKPEMKGLTDELLGTKTK